jgi:hypothetical protein
MTKKDIPFDQQEDSEDLKEAKRLYDVMYEARQELEKYRGVRSTSPRKEREAVGDAIIKLSNSERQLAEFIKHIDIVDVSKLHIYGRRKQGLPTR